MAFSALFEQQLDSWLDMDAKVLQGKHLDDSETIDNFSQHYLDGAAAMDGAAQTTEEKAIVFQWRGFGRLLEALSGLER